MEIKDENNFCARHGHYYEVYATEKEEKNSVAGLSGMRDFIAGSFAGVASTTVGHPFDTVKLRLQMAQGNFSGALDCTTQTIQKEGVRGLYRGMMSPLATVPLANAVVFGTYGQAKTFLQSRHLDQTTPLTPMEAMLAGAWAGFINTVVITPVELIKCRLQAQGGAIGSVAKYNGTIDCIRKIAQSQDEVTKLFLAQNGPETMWQTVLSGGLAGCVCWTVSYPQDVVKSRLQLAAKVYPKHRWIPDGGFLNCGRSIIRQEGASALWTGFTPCLVRAFPVCAASFIAYEVVKEAFLKSDSVDGEPLLS